MRFDPEEFQVKLLMWGGLAVIGYFAVMTVYYVVRIIGRALGISN